MSPADPVSGVPELPFSTVEDYEFRFVGEGAANVVFEVQVRPSDGSSANIFQGNLLRVPKAGTKAHSYRELHEYWETVVKPLFEPQDLVQHRLVRLGSEEVVARMNAVLTKEDHTRRPDFRGSRVAAAEYGMLIEDMRQRHPDDLTFEFKPKWLAQSPNAPRSATRCRNCAREALKQHHTKPLPEKEEEDDDDDDGATILCPLDLLTCASSTRALANILTSLSRRTSRSVGGALSSSPPPSSSQKARLSHWLRTNGLLPRLRAAQLANDAATGPLGAEAHDGRFQLAMTLRDCTCFVRIPADAGAAVEAKLADLDKKNSAAKLGYWKATERRLIEGGYYEGRERPRQRTNCQLERGRGRGEAGADLRNFKFGVEGKNGRCW